MEQKTSEKCGGDCRCGSGRGACAGWCGGWHHGAAGQILRWALAIAILAIVFKVGVEVGEFKSEVREYLGNTGVLRHHLMMPGAYGDADDFLFFKERKGMMRGAADIGTTAAR